MMKNDTPKPLQPAVEEEQQQAEHAEHSITIMEDASTIMDEASRAVLDGAMLASVNEH